MYFGIRQRCLLKWSFHWVVQVLIFHSHLLEGNPREQGPRFPFMTLLPAPNMCLPQRRHSCTPPATYQVVKVKSYNRTRWVSEQQREKTSLREGHLRFWSLSIWVDTAGQLTQHLSQLLECFLHGRACIAPEKMLFSDALAARVLQASQAWIWS